MKTGDAKPWVYNQFDWLRQPGCRSEYLHFGNGTLGALGKIWMALKFVRTIPALGFVFILLTTLIPWGNVHALEDQFNGADLPLLGEFVSQVRNGQAGELRGIYIPEILAARIVQQPAKNYEFVSSSENIVTEFGLASQFGSTGLLAHNDLAGESFFLLKENQKFYLIYGDGQYSAFVVTEILRYRALEPASSSSKFVALEDNDTLLASELFSKVYDRDGEVVLQTCIAAYSNLMWGRLFVIAEPYFR